MRGIHQRKEAPYSKLGGCVKVSLVGGQHQLTSDVPVTVKTSKTPAVKEGRAYSHEIDGLSFDGGDESSGHVSSNTSRLCGGMSLFRSER